MGCSVLGVTDGRVTDQRRPFGWEEIRTVLHALPRGAALPFVARDLNLLNVAGGIISSAAPLLDSSRFSELLTSFSVDMAELETSSQGTFSRR